MFIRLHIIVMAISSQYDSSIFGRALSQAVPGSAERGLLEESEGSSNEQHTLRIANKPTLE